MRAAISSTSATPPPWVVTLDVGSSSARALCFDARGQALPCEAQEEYEPTTTPDGGVEVDPDRLCALAATTLDALLAALGSGVAAVAGVAVSTFWHTLLGVGVDDRACTPVYSWADTRSAGAVEALRSCLDEPAYHARTGCHLHTSYLPARLRWLADRDPAGFDRVHRWMSFGEYLELVFCGVTRCSVSVASGTGLFDQHAQAWDGPTLAALGIRPEQLSPIVDVVPSPAGLRPAFARRWPALARAAWFPPLGDGACSNVGAGCTVPTRAALMVGTSGAMRVCSAEPVGDIPAGLWCYRVDRRRVVLGGSLSNGGSLYAWLRDTLQLGPPDTLEARLAEACPDGHGLTVLPFLAGERSTGWEPRARAAIVGLSLASQPLDLLQAGLETVAYRFALVYERLRTVRPRVEAIVATGGALTASPAWTRMMADVLGLPVTRSTEPEASSRGAALVALEALGALPALEEAPAALGATVLPDPERHARYRVGLARHRRLYDALIPFYKTRSGLAGDADRSPV